MPPTTGVQSMRPLPSRAQFLARLLRNAAVGGGLLAGSLALGTVGYHATEGLPWLDAALNAAMLLTGEGLIAPLHTVAGKLFAIAYALFSSLAFLTAAGVLLAPALHRFLHRFHLELVELAEAPRRSGTAELA